MFGHGQRRRVWFAVVGAFVAGSLITTPPGTAAGADDEFVPLEAPVRLLDTRPGGQTVDGQFAGIGGRAADSTLRLDVGGRAGLPADVDSVVLNVTAVDALGWGYATVHPTASARPNASNLNFDTGQTIANTVVTPVGPDGAILLYTSAGTNLLVDAVGHLPSAAFTPLATSARLLDTRPGASTVDGAFAGMGGRTAGSTLELDVAGRAGIPVGVSAVVLNVTATMPDGWGYVTVHPSGTVRPNASNLNYDTGTTVANTVVTALGADGRVSIYTYGSTHLIVDVAGHLAPTSFMALPAPARVLDTRLGASTADGQQAGIGLRCASSTVRVALAGRVGLPADASSAVLNVTVVDPLGWGYLTEHPTGSGRPNASNLNYVARTTIANTVVARLGAGGDVCVYTYGATHLIVDVVGYLPGPPPPPDGPTCPPMAYGSSRSLGSGVTVADVNNAGVAVGTEWHGSAERSTAIWWPTLDDGPRAIPGVPDSRASHSIAINNRNQVLVHAYSDVTGAHVLVIDLPSGRATGLTVPVEVPGTEPVGVDHVSAVAMNDRGEVAVNVLHDEHGAYHLAAVWDTATGELDSHPELLSESMPRDINDLGQVVGSTFHDAFLWDRDTDVVHRLDRGGFVVAGAGGLNDRGQVVGTVSDGKSFSTAVLWETRDAPPTYVPGTFPVVRDLNEAGLGIGSLRHAGDVWPSPGVWDSVSGQWLAFPSSPWYSIHAINDVGQVVGLTGHVQPAVWDPV